MGIARFAQRTIPDQSRAQKRSNIDIAVLLWQRKTKSRVSDGEFRVTAVDGVAGETRTVAKVLPIRSTINAVAVGPAEPWNSDTLTNRKFFCARSNCFDAPDNLVSGDQRQFRIRQFAIDNVQIGATNRARAHAHEQLSRLGVWLRDIAQHERLPRFLEDHRAHLDLLCKIRPHRLASVRALRRRHSAWAHLHDAYGRCVRKALCPEHAPGTTPARGKSRALQKE